VSGAHYLRLIAREGVPLDRARARLKTESLPKYLSALQSRDARAPVVARRTHVASASHGVMVSSHAVILTQDTVVP
jgi:hypothetical protein